MGDGQNYEEFIFNWYLNNPGAPVSPSPDTVSDASDLISVYPDNEESYPIIHSNLLYDSPDEAEDALDEDVIEDLIEEDQALNQLRSISNISSAPPDDEVNYTSDFESESDSHHSENNHHLITVIVIVVIVVGFFIIPVIIFYFIIIDF